MHYSNPVCIIKQRMRDVTSSNINIAIGSVDLREEGVRERVREESERRGGAEKVKVKSIKYRYFLFQSKK